MPLKRSNLESSESSGMKSCESSPTQKSVSKKSSGESSVSLDEVIRISISRDGDGKISVGEYELIGDLIINPKVVIEERNDGIVFFKGNYFHLEIPIKRVPITNSKAVEKEIQFLRDCDENLNVVRFFKAEKDQNFIYLALDHCKCNLYELIMGHTYLNPSEKLWIANGYPSSALLKIMRDIVNGLAGMHGKRILHRNLKPHNILIRKSLWRAMITDLSSGEKLDQMTGFESQSQAYAADLFSLGCIFLFCISRDYHPFGEEDLSRIECTLEAKLLITSLLDPNPLSRPDIEQVRIHPLLWDSKIKLTFLQEASYRFESEFSRMKENSTLLQQLERIGKVGNWKGNWDSDVLRKIIDLHEPVGVYKFHSVRDLVVFIRKTSFEYNMYSRKIKKILGRVPGEFVYNFSKKFPNLFMAVYTVIETHCKEEETFRKYFTADHVCPHS